MDHIGDAKALAKFERFTNLFNLAERRGKTGKITKFGKKKDKFGGIVEERGLDASGLDILDFDSPGFSLEKAGALFKAFTKDAKGKPHKSQFDAHLRNIQGENVRAENTRQREETFDSTAALVREGLEELLSSPTISAKELSAMRSETARGARVSEANRLKRASAVFGQRGLDPSSPGGAFLANLVAEEADTALTDDLRELGLDVERINEEFQRSELEMATRLETTLQASRQALIDGDFDRVLELNAEIGDINEAIRQQRELNALMEGQRRNTESFERGNMLIEGGFELGSAFFGNPSLFGDDEEE